MGWIFVPIEIATTATKSDPTVVDLKLMSGSIRRVAVIMPLTTNQHEAGIRVNTPKGVIFPITAEGADAWLLSGLVAFNQVYEMRAELEKVPPVFISVEGFNTDSAARFAQVGIYIEPYNSRVEEALQNITAWVAALTQVSIMPEFIKQIQLFISVLFGGNKDE